MPPQQKIISTLFRSTFNAIQTGEDVKIDLTALKDLWSSTTLLIIAPVLATLVLKRKTQLGSTY